VDSALPLIGHLAWNLIYTLAIPWMIIYVCLWTIDRCAEDRLRLLPISPWNMVYKKLQSLSSTLIELLVHELAFDKLYAAMNPERCTQQTMKTLTPYFESFTDQLIRPHAPVIWDNLPRRIKSPIYQRVEHRFEPCIDRMFQDAMAQGFALEFEHQQFIHKALLEQESGYRFLVAEALHNRWFLVRRKAQIYSLVVLFALTIVTGLVPNFWWSIYISPFIISLVVFRQKPTIDRLTHQQFALSLSYWLSEKIYSVDQVTLHLTQHIPTIDHLKQEILKAFQPLTEDLPLKTLTQVLLGGEALLKMRINLVDYLLTNATIPFEHSQFRKERAQEINQFFYDGLLKVSPQKLHQILNPLLTYYWWLLVLASLSIAITLSLLTCLFVFFL